MKNYVVGWYFHIHLKLTGLEIMWDDKTCRTSKTIQCVFTYNHAKMMQKYKPKNALDKACWGDIFHFIFIEKCLENQPNLYHVHMLTNKQKGYKYNIINV
jgi:hypothetical protein